MEAVIGGRGHGQERRWVPVGGSWSAGGSLSRCRHFEVELEHDMKERNWTLCSWIWTQEKY
ncbi:hypothetical protein M6B38_408345 [Iris pallida]|uniref:Uncharacterized protein n=1 Tax=Iris pallida TaxID=29817 RepID=A0AAX6FP14_IRIPA|nr:hypothetical protein M6B38_408345 [Iris pallida]